MVIARTRPVVQSVVGVVSVVCNAELCLYFRRHKAFPPNILISLITFKTFILKGIQGPIGPPGPQGPPGQGLPGSKVTF